MECLYPAYVAPLTPTVVRNPCMKGTVKVLQDLLPYLTHGNIPVQATQPLILR